MSLLIAKAGSETVNREPAKKQAQPRSGASIFWLGRIAGLTFTIREFSFPVPGPWSTQS